MTFMKSVAWFVTLIALFTVPFAFLWQRLDLSAPPGFSPAALALALVALAGVLLAVALKPVFGRLSCLGRVSLLRWIAPGALVPLLILLLSAGPLAQAQNVRMRAWTNLPVVVTTLATSNINANPYTLQKGRGVGIAIRFTGSSATAVTNLVINLDRSPDGTNWTTDMAPMNAVFLGTNGTTLVFGLTNLLSIYPSLLDNTFQIRGRNITNAGAATANLSNVWWTYNND